MNKSLKVPLDDDTLARLEARGRETGQPLPALAGRYIEEALRMDRHPGILFKDGPAGRRAALVGGPDVWEVMALFLHDEDGITPTVEEFVRERTGLTNREIDAVLNYYAEYPNEIEQQVRSNEEAVRRAYATWTRDQARAQA